MDRPHVAEPVVTVAVAAGFARPHARHLDRVATLLQYWLTAWQDYIEVTFAHQVALVLVPDTADTTVRLTGDILTVPVPVTEGIIASPSTPALLGGPVLAACLQALLGVDGYRRAPARQVTWPAEDTDPEDQEYQPDPGGIGEHEMMIVAQVDGEGGEEVSLLDFDDRLERALKGVTGPSDASSNEWVVRLGR